MLARGRGEGKRVCVDVFEMLGDFFNCSDWIDLATLVSRYVRLPGDSDHPKSPTDTEWAAGRSELCSCCGTHVFSHLGSARMVVAGRDQFADVIPIRSTPTATVGVSVGDLLDDVRVAECESTSALDHPDGGERLYLQRTGKV